MHMHASAGQNRSMQRVLRFSLAATFAYVLATFYFGMRAHSLALISEAGHNVSDMLAIVLSYVAVYFQTRPATEQKTFGYPRAGVLAAFVNALALIVLSVWIGVSAVHRLSAPVEVQPRLMMYVAAAGVVMNGVIAGLLWKCAGDVNIRSVFLHMLGDTLSTAAVIAGGAGILLYEDDVDRPGAVADYRGDDSVELSQHRAGDAEHPAGRRSAIVARGSGARGDAGSSGRARRA